MVRRCPQIAWVNLAVALATSAFFVFRGGYTVDTMFDLICITVRIGFPLFIAALVVGPLRELIDSSATRWLVAQRRYLGLSYATWHLLHWPILASFLVLLGPTTFWQWFGDPHFLIPATIVLLLITALAATSTDGAQRRLGRAWSALHMVGVYAIWAWFLRMYLSYYPYEMRPYIDVYRWLLVGSLAFRWSMTAKRLVVHRA